MQGIEVIDAECYCEHFTYCPALQPSADSSTMWCLKAAMCLFIGMLLGHQFTPKNTSLTILEAHTCNNFAMNAVSMTTDKDLSLIHI